MMAVFSPEDKAALAEETPLCRLGAPEDVAAAVAFLASDAGAFFTGQVLAPNGGFVVCGFYRGNIRAGALCAPALFRIPEYLRAAVKPFRPEL